MKRGNGSGDDILISGACICRRYKISRLFVEGSKLGPKLPFHLFENEFVEVIVQMARMRQVLSPSEAISLINSMIMGAHHQKNFIAFKAIHCCNASGTVGVSYWRGFIKRMSTGLY